MIFIIFNIHTIQNIVEEQDYLLNFLPDGKQHLLAHGNTILLIIWLYIALPTQYIMAYLCYILLYYTLSFKP